MYQNMKNEKITNTKMIFRVINNDLDLLMNGSENEKRMAYDKLKIINEELSDHVLNMVIAINN